MSTSRALVVYARPPLPGRVKTRLQPELTPDEGLALYRAMLADTLERLADALEGSARLFLAWSAQADPPDDIGVLLNRYEVEYQMGDDLGERMASTLQTRLREGHRQVVLIGSDSPNLPLDYVDQAFEALMAVDLVTGPCDDGGYYLLGARRILPQVFRNVPWGSDQVLAVTRQRVKRGGVLYHELPAWYDVDTTQDVGRLWKDLLRMRAKGVEAFPARTWKALTALGPGRF